jgi:putative nucleotidyltransferase-like protein
VREWSRAALLAETHELDRPPRPATQDEPDLLAAINRQRVADLLHQNAASLDLPTSVRDQIATAHRDAARMLLVRVLEMARLQQVLADAEVPWLSLKGPALAVQTTGDPAARGVGDIDVLVDSADVARVCTSLAAAGWVIRPYGSAVPGTWAWRHVIASFNEMTFDGPSSTVDLHWRLDPTQGALPGFKTLWDRRIRVDVGDLAVDTLGLVDAFTHTCHHAAKDDWRWLRSLADIHRLARQPEIWTGRSPSRIERASLLVTDALLGLPPEVPEDIRERRNRSSARMVARAVHAQDRSVFAKYPIPGAQSLRDVRYRVSASAAPADVARAVGAAVVPANSVSDLDDRTALTAVPRMLTRRGRWLARRIVAWVRREPGAALAQAAAQR